MLDLVLRPAAAAGLAFEKMLGGELAAGAIGDYVALEVGFAAKQPESIADLPGDRHAVVDDGGIGRGGSTGLKRLRGGRVTEACTEHKEEGGGSR